MYPFTTTREGTLMKTARKKAPQARPSWECEAIALADRLGVPRTEMTKALQQTIIDYAAQGLFERKFKTNITDAITSIASAEAVQAEAPTKDTGTAFEQKVKKEKAVFPGDLR
jgi:hypothetical protein